MCCYKIMKQKLSEDQLSAFICLYFHLYSCYIKVLYIYSLVKFHTLGFILKKYATIASDICVSSYCVITKLCLTRAHSLYSVLTGICCLEMKHNHRSWLTNNLQTKRTLPVWLFWHFTMIYCSYDCLIDNRCFLLPCGLHLYFLHNLKPTFYEWTVQQKLFVLPNTDCKSLSCTGYEIITKTIIPLETLLLLQWHILWRSL
jgi:hypothetical protein